MKEQEASSLERKQFPVLLYPLQKMPALLQLSRSKLKITKANLLSFLFNRHTISRGNEKGEERAAPLGCEGEGNFCKVLLLNIRTSEFIANHLESI